VDILFKTLKLQKLCNEQKKRDQTYGPLQSKLLGRRLDQMSAALNLFEFSQVHSRCHRLKGERRGEWSADLDGPYRLIFEPFCSASDSDDPEVVRREEAYSIIAITVVRILEVGVDTHE